MSRSGTTLAAAVAICAVSLLASASAFAAADKDQQKCINAMNKAGAKVGATQGKENTACLKNAGKGKLPSGQTADECLRADTKGKMAKATGKTTDAFTKKCLASPPTFGVPAGTVASTVNDVAIDQSLSLLADIFGASLTNAAIDCDADKPGCQCQQAVSKTYEKLAATKLREFGKCKKNALKNGASSAADLAKCVDDAGTVGSIADDEKGKIAKVVTKLGDDIAGKCAGLNTGVVFPGWCGGLLGTALRDCIDARVECRVCLELNLRDNLSVDCDTFDDGQLNTSCPLNTFNLRSTAAPANSPGSPGVTVTNPKLITQFGSAQLSLNNARYTRYRLNETATAPDTVLVLIPGFEGGAGTFKILAENLIARVFADEGLVLEVWAYDRRSNQLEDTLGLDIAEAQLDALIGLDWLFGGELTLALSPELPRRAVFYDAQGDTPFIANWTSLVFSQDIDAIVEKALTVAPNGNVFLGGHSAGTGFAARYAATDFNLTGIGPSEPGYAKLRGLVLFEGGGGSTAGTALTADTLDRIEAKFDGGLFGAVRDNPGGGQGRCMDGPTACTIANEATTCAAFAKKKCTLPTTAYSTSAILNPRILAGVEPAGVQGYTDPDTGQIILQVDQGAAGNNAVAKVPDLSILAVLPPGTVYGGIGSFIDDDGPIAAAASFVATSVGFNGPMVGPVLTWLVSTDPQPPAAIPNNGPAPTSLPAAVWGQEKEVTRFDRMLTTFVDGKTNFVDWYYPSSGLSVTSVSGVCTASTCTVGNVGAACSSNAQCSQAINLDSTALSVGRGRRDIENLTQAAAINIPVIGFGGSNGLVRAPGNFTPFGQSIGLCTAPSCDGTARVVDALNPNPAFPTLGDVDGGFEVHMSEGFAHVDVLTAEDDVDNNVLIPLTDFIGRNVQ